MKILGISAFYHDSAAALIDNGQIVAAAEEERFSRKKHDSEFPSNAIDYCLSHTPPKDLAFVAFYDQPLLKLQRLLETHLAFAPEGYRPFEAAFVRWTRGKLFQKQMLVNGLKRSAPDLSLERGRLLFFEHHLSHAASAFFPSPFEEALILTMDGVGEWATTTVALGNRNEIRMMREIQFPHSLGLLYSAFTAYTGFRVNSGEYKMMGLAPYGRPSYAQAILDNLIDLKGDGSFRLNLKYFAFCTDFQMTNSRFEALFGGPARKPDEPLTQRHMDLAASVQAVLDQIVVRMTSALSVETGARNLCLAGGVALNCVTNAKVLRKRSFDHFWIQPAAGDAGGALGAALAAFHIHSDRGRELRTPDGMQGGFLGPAFSQEEIEARLHRIGARFAILDELRLLDECVKALLAGKAVGWFQGRMEFGPRALGARSILGDARSPTMQSILNLKIKYRESFRPFAPAVLAEDASEWFETEEESPYMLVTADVARRHRRDITPTEARLAGIDMLKPSRSDIPAVTHVDYSARLQTVRRETNRRFYELILRFKQSTGCPVIVNTSFNVRGEPIVCTPEDAFICFMATEIEALAIENCLLWKWEQDPQPKQAHCLDLQTD